MRVQLAKLVTHFITIDNIDARTIAMYIVSCSVVCCTSDIYIYFFIPFYELCRTLYLFVVRAISIFIFYYFFFFSFAINKYLVIYDSCNQSYFSFIELS